jgi:hypothetical protein
MVNVTGKHAFMKKSAWKTRWLYDMSIGLVRYFRAFLNSWIWRHSDGCNSSQSSQNCSLWSRDRKFTSSRTPSLPTPALPPISQIRWETTSPNARPANESSSSIETGRYNHCWCWSSNQRPRNLRSHRFDLLVSINGEIWLISPHTLPTCTSYLQAREFVTHITCRGLRIEDEWTLIRYLF